MKKRILKSSLLFLILGCGAFISGCSTESEGSKQISNLVYNGTNISWDSVKNAKNYLININDGKDIIVSQQNGTVAYEYDSQGREFKFSIEAIIKSGSDKNPTFEITFEPIETVKNLAVDEGKLTWDYVSEADSYEIMLGSQIQNQKVMINQFELEPGPFVARVRASKGDAEAINGNNKYYSYWSQPLNGDLLTTPTNLQYDSEKFTWDEVKNADSYVIKIGNDKIDVKGNSYQFTTTNEDLKISVKAKGNGKNTFDSAFCEEKKYSYIPAITGITVEDGVLVWNKPNNTVKYKIKINGIVQDGFLTTEKYENLQAGVSYRISILPIGDADFYYSTWSNELTINILRSPSISFNNNVLQWNQITGAAGYTLKIVKPGDKQEVFTLSNETFTYNYPFDEIGAYDCSIKSTVLSTSNGVYESKYSNSYIVERLAAPTNITIQNQPLETNQVMISCSSVSHASRYVLYVNQSEVTSNTQPIFNVDVNRLSSVSTESVLNFSIKSVGSVSPTVAYLDSNSQAQFDITKLATPLNVKINGNQITWDSVPNTNQYVITIDGKRTIVTSTNYTLTDLASGSHTIYVQAMGNSKEIITSSYSNVLEITKLSQPTIRVEKDNSTGKFYLTWNSISGARSYKVVIGNTNYDAITNRFDISGYESYFTEGIGSQVSVYAIGNGENIVDSDVSNTKTIVRYATPTNLGLSADSLTWNSQTVDGISPNQYTICIDEQEFVVSSPFYPLANINAGRHTVKVKINGDYVNSIDSPFTEEFIFTKLDEVTNIQKSGNKITWDVVTGATAYLVKLSQDDIYKTVASPEVEVNYKTAGEFAISIIAVSDNVTYANSSAKTFALNVKAISQPVKANDLTNENSFTIQQTGNHVVITIHENSHATAYKLIVGGRETIQESNVFELDLIDSGIIYEIQVQIVGNVFGDDGIYYISSNPSIVYQVSF